MTAKLIKLTEDMAKRVRRSRYVFDRDRCLICGWDFADCLHDIYQNERVVMMVKDRDGII